MRTLLLLLVPSFAAAQSLHTEHTAQGLAFDRPCAQSVTVTIDSALHDKISVDATAATQAEIEKLHAESEDRTLKISNTSESCETNSETLKLAIRVPPRTPISIEDSGGGAYHLPDTHAPLSIDSSGSVSITAGAIAALSVDLSGSGSIDVARLEAPAHIGLSGSGEIRLGGGDIHALSIDASGSGKITYGAGSIGALELSSSGNTTIGIEATIGAASLELSGSSAVRLHRVTGPVSQDSEGSAQVTIDKQG